MTTNDTNIQSAYAAAKERYAALGVDTDAALKRLAAIPISLHCWQGDDVGGFENAGEELGGGLAVTGNYPGKARTPDELRADLDQAFALIPGTHRLNLHAFYGEFGGQPRRPQRNSPRAFPRLDRLGQGATGSAWTSIPPASPTPRPPTASRSRTADEGIREFWIEHGIACRQIGAAIGKALGTPCVTNVWIPDGYKDMPVDRHGPRERLAAVARRHLRREARPEAQPRRRRGQALRHRLGELRRRLARVLPGLRRSRSKSCSASTPATSIPPRRSPTSSRPRSAGSPKSCCTSAAACAGTATTW